MKRVQTVVALSFVLVAAGCAGNGNVKGSWNCGPATAGSCAPTSSIDDGAIKQIIGNTNQAVDGGSGSVPGSYGSDTAGRRAKVEFPPYTDERGRYHEPTIVYMNIADDVSVTDGSGSRVLGMVDPAMTPSGPVRQNLVTTATESGPVAVDQSSLMPTDNPTNAPAQPRPGLLQRVFGGKPKPAALPAPAPSEDVPVNSPDKLNPPTGE